jgi:hypothetical protein
MLLEGTKWSLKSKRDYAPYNERLIFFYPNDIANIDDRFISFSFNSKSELISWVDILEYSGQFFNEDYIIGTAKDIGSKKEEFVFTATFIEKFENIEFNEGYKFYVKGDYLSAFAYFKQFLANWKNKIKSDNFLSLANPNYSDKHFFEPLLRECEINLKAKAKELYTNGYFNDALEIYHELEYTTEYYWSLYRLNYPYENTKSAYEYYQRIDNACRSYRQTYRKKRWFPFLSNKEKVKISSIIKLSEEERIFKNSKEYNAESEIYFGKYKGKTIQFIITYDIDYLLWCINNLNSFYININLFSLDKIMNHPKFLQAFELNLLKMDVFQYWGYQDFLDDYRGSENFLIFSKMHSYYERICMLI